MSMYSNPIYGSTQLQLAQSIIEARQSLATPIKQHFVEWFSGDALDSIWTTNNGQGTGTFAMVDAVDEGFGITTSAVYADRSGIWFGGSPDHYSPSASVYIATMKRLESTNTRIVSGLSGSGGSEPFAGTGNAWAGIESDTDLGANFYVTNRNATNFVQLATSIAQDTNFHKVNGMLGSTYHKGYVDSVFAGINTTFLPNLDLEPGFGIVTRTTASRTGRIRYFEAMNL